MCGLGNKKSTEHVIPRWLLEFWGPGKFTGVPGDPKARSLVKIFLCVECNAHFNTTLEQNCASVLRRMFRGETLTVSPKQQAHIAAWFVKMWILMSLWPEFDNSDDPFLSTAERHAFRRDMTFPGGTRIWVGAVEDRTEARLQAVLEAIPDAFDSLATENYWMVPVGSVCHVMQFSHTFAVVFRLLPAEFHGAQPLVDARAMVRNAEQAGLLTKLWPGSADGMAWPLAASFEPTTFAHWSTRFGYVPPGTAPRLTNVPRGGLSQPVMESLDRWAGKRRAR